MLNEHYYNLSNVINTIEAYSILMGIIVSGTGVFDKFIKLHNKRNTRKHYTRILKQFFIAINIRDFAPKIEAFEGSTYERYAYEINLAKLYAEVYFKDGRDYETDVLEYCRTKVGKIAPKSYKAIVAVLKKFFLYNEVPLSEVVWQSVRNWNRGSHPISRDKVPTPEILAKVIKHLPLRGRALFLTLISSGMRIGEALSIKLEDIYLDEDPPRIELYNTKTRTGFGRDVYISNEAREAIEDWLLSRDRYVTHRRMSMDRRLFPFTRSICYTMWNGALRKTGYNERCRRTKRRVYHIHTTRKFFATFHRGDPEVKEYLLGHYDIYNRPEFDSEYVVEQYKLGEENVTIFEPSSDILKELELQRKQIAQMKMYMDRIVKELLPMLETEDVKELSKSYKELFE